MQVIISSWTFAELVHFRVRSKPVARSQTKETAMPNLIIDRVGERFGRWTVLALHPERSRFGKARWVCRCDCGSERIVYGNSLRRGETTSCGCARLVDLTGQRFGRWQVLALHPERKRQGPLLRDLAVSLRLRQRRHRSRKNCAAAGRKAAAAFEEKHV